MTWDSIQQVVRIIIYSISGYFLGDTVVNGPEFTSAVGGLMAVGGFMWWYFWNRHRA